METYQGETILWSGHPSWKSMLLFYIRWVLVSLIPVIVYAGIKAGTSSHPGLTLFAALTIIGLVLTLTVGWIRRVTTVYRITNRRIQIRRGIVSRNERSANVDRIQNVNVRQSVGQRILGIGDVDWDTAGSETAESDFTFHGVDDPSALVRHADTFAQQGPPAGASPQGL
jgi:uncharacterized membrane protein YdbT with pleckstrin-like domain